MTIFTTFFTDRCVIRGIRIPLLREHQRQEMSGPRLSSNNGTNPYEQQRWVKDVVANPPTNPDQVTKKVCVENLEKEERHTNWRVAAATNANSRVQRNPKSKSSAEIKAGHLAAAEGLPTGSAQGYQKVMWADGVELSPPTPIRGYYQQLPYELQYQSRLLCEALLSVNSAADTSRGVATKANSKVQRSPKSQNSGETMAWADLEEDAFATPPRKTVQEQKSAAPPASVVGAGNFDAEVPVNAPTQEAEAGKIDANSVVQGNPKSSGNGEEKYWRQACADLEEELPTDDVLSDQQFNDRPTN